MDENLHICTDLHLDINRNAIANQIIRYKDAFKMPEGQICIPYIIYGKDEDSQRASIVLFGEKEDYIFAKAYYYVISEPDNMYEGTRNEIISMVVCDETKDVFNEAMERYFVKKEKAGLIQRFADRRLFKDYDEMIELARVRGEKLQEEAKEFGAFMANEGAEQCGFCNPGFIMNVFAMLKELEDPTEEDILEYLSGNLCRCSGFVGQTRSILKFLDYKKGQEEGK